jgi:hypothetical protein
MNDELSPDAKTLLAEVRASYSPDPRRIAAVRAALDVRLGAPPAQGSGGGLLGPTGAAAHPLALGVIAAALAGGVLTLALRHEKAPAPVPTLTASTPNQTSPRVAPPGIEPPAQSPVRSAANGDGPPALAVSDLPIARPPRSPLRSKGDVQPPEPPRVESTPPPSPDDSDDSLAREVSLLRAARAALDGGRAEQALTLLQRHALLWPRGVLVEERLATQVFAMCALGRVTEAAAKARELEGLAPHSPHLARVRTSCAGSPVTTAP